MNNICLIIMFSCLAFGLIIDAVLIVLDDRRKKKLKLLERKIETLKTFEEQYQKKVLDVLDIKEATINSLKEEKK
jgi:uncharacterized membrane-anchored protein YhcB (DUF1043 family)